jgi:hypothetical protein
MMNLKWTLSAVILAGALAGTASQASAQSQYYRGTFQLDVATRFGTSVLQPGKYTISTLEGAKGIRITGDRASVALLAAGYDVAPETDKARMILVDSDGMYTLQSFESGAMGKSLRFYLPKTHGQVERASIKPNIEVALQ